MALANPPTPAQVIRAQLLPMVMVFLLPLLTLGFTHHALGRLDERFLEQARPSIAADDRLSAEEREGLRRFVEANPPSKACVDEDPQLASYRERLRSVCGDFSQFQLAQKASLWALLLGLLMSVLGGVFAGIAHTAPNAQFVAFVVGWRSMQVLAAVETLVQAALAVWLSYWLTAFFLHVYVVKLILVVGFLAAAMVWYTVKNIFISGDSLMRADAVRIAPTQAPQLFERIRELSARVGTQAPANLLAGIDDSFFVTEVPLETLQGVVEGRSLFVSFSLLRLLSREEADAVLCHELGHFVGGDTAFTQKMAPRLASSQRYLIALYETGSPVFYVMRAFFVIFDLALAKTEREREFAADALAARMVSGDALSRALLKVAAYAQYRTRVENTLFASKETHQTLSIPERIAEGFAGYVNSKEFLSDMQQAATPHPFDSHPKIEARMESVGTKIPAEQYASAVLQPSNESWRSAFLDAEQIEAQMWDDYERRFASAHQFSLALRYLPSTAEEEALVVRFFPEQRFETPSGAIVVDFRSVQVPEWTAPLAFDQISTLAVNERMFKRYLDIKTAEGTTQSIQLEPLNAEEQPFLDTLDQYIGRHRQARRLAEESSQRSDVV